jgi:PRTRC genetic system ThiF family protein
MTDAPYPYMLPGHLRQNHVNLHLIGCGGTGSQVLTGLARLHATLIALGHPGGLGVTAFDPDIVSPSNIGRQLFSPADVGHPKASVLVHRINTFFGLGWAAIPERYPQDLRNQHITVSCVDSAKARAEIGTILSRSYHGDTIWIDLGNDRDTGQVVWGNPATRSNPDAQRLPTVLDLFPELASPDYQAMDRDEPSCSIAASLSRQSLFINQAVATLALNALFRAFRFGGLAQSAWFVNLDTGATSALPVDPAAWNRFGIGAVKPATRTKRKRKTGA